MTSAVGGLTTNVDEMADTFALVDWNSISNISGDIALLTVLLIAALVKSSHTKGLRFTFYVQISC